MNGIREHARSSSRISLRSIRATQLPAGTYTIEASVGRRQVGLSSGGQTNTFLVVRISNQQFLQRVQSGRVRVEDFPFTGDTTILEWDQPSQNFQIVDTE